MSLRERSPRRLPKGLCLHLFAPARFQARKRNWTVGDRTVECDIAIHVHDIKKAPVVASQVPVEIREAYEGFRAHLIFDGDNPDANLICDQGDIIVISSTGADVKQANKETGG